MNVFGRSLCGIFAVVLFSSWSAGAQPRSVYFWNSAVGSGGSRVNMDSATVGVWGNGAFAEARNVRYEGANTLRIITRNFREGVRFDLKTPLDITPYRETGYIRLRLKFNETAAGAPAAGAGAQPAYPGLPGMPAAPGAGFGGTPLAAPGFIDGARYSGQAQIGALPPLGGKGGLGTIPGIGDLTPAVPAGPPPQETPITQLLCTLVHDNGVMEGVIEIPKDRQNPRRIDEDEVRPDANGWLLFVLPLAEMRSTPGASGLARRLILSADGQDAFHLTQAALVVETGEMAVSIRQLNDPPGTQKAEIEVRPGQVTLVADVEAGAADPAIEWNFDADNIGNTPHPNAPQGAPDGEQAPLFPQTLPGAGAPGAAIIPGEAPNFGGEPAAAEPLAVGPRIDARGLIARFRYPDEEQNYRVEVTVRDRTGKKEPVTASILVKVRY